MVSNMDILARCINDYWNCNYTEISPGIFATLFNAGQSREYFIAASMRVISVKKPVCRNQCCLSGHLSGAGRWCGIVGYFTFETAYYHFATGRNLFTVCKKWSGGRFNDLVGISDYRSNCMPGRLCIFKED